MILYLCRIESSYDRESVAFPSFSTVIDLPSGGALTIKNGSMPVQIEILEFFEINPSAMRFTRSGLRRSHYMAIHFESDGTFAWTLEL